MLELYAEALLAFLLLAGVSHRWRRVAGVTPMTGTMLRVAAAMLLAFALWRAGTAMDGERLIRAVVACSLAAITVVLALSFAPPIATRSIRRVPEVEGR